MKTKKCVTTKMVEEQLGMRRYRQYAHTSKMRRRFFMVKGSGPTLWMPLDDAVNLVQRCMEREYSKRMLKEPRFAKDLIKRVKATKKVLAQVAVNVEHKRGIARVA